MRNLRIARHATPIFEDQVLPLAATTWDTLSDSIICAFGPSTTEAVIELRRIDGSSIGAEGTSQVIATWDAPCPNPDLECDKILSLQFFPDTSTICLVLAGGDIILVREQPLPEQDAIEIVGSVDAGISAAAWSPDEELLALSTNAGTVIYMTREFDALVNITLSPEDVKASNHVSVGWGKAETQFKGKRAKALRDPTVPEHVDEGILSPVDDHSTTITWRGDGAYVAVNTVDDDKHRMIRVYSRDGELDSVSQPVDNLEGALSWRPSGNLIAGIQRKSDRIDIVFFERNGLRHGEFSLRLTSEEQSTWASTIKLHWNTDSTVLAVAFKDRVQFWTMGNYHYYLKQEIRAVSGSSSKEPLWVSWHPEKALKVVLNDSDRLQDIAFASMISCGSRSSPNDHGLVAVIDGGITKLTPLRLANVPPPVSLHEIVQDASVRDVAITPSGKRVAVLGYDEVATYEYLDSKRPRAPRLLSRRKIRLSNVVPRQIALRDDDQLFVLGDDTQSHKSLLCHSIDDGELSFDAATPLSEGALDLALSLDSQQACILSARQTVTEYAVTEGILQPHNELHFPAQVASIEMAHVNGESIAFGLTVGGSLYANSRLLARNANSFLLTSAHLIFTTTQHLLKFVHLTAVDNMDVPADEPELDERCRRVERGARLVTAMPTAYSVVLQMPRGNLETVYPRAMVVDGIRKAIDGLDYRTAFMACRGQRVDMNILYDHAPEQFLAQVGTFVRQLADASYLDLFVSQLREEDVTLSMYRNTAKDLPSERPAVGDKSTGQLSTPNAGGGNSPSSKVNGICDALLHELEKSAESRMQNIITAHVCKNPPDLDAGLTVVGEIRKSDSAKAEKAAEHICFLADVNQLYDYALGLYDLDLALLIAQQSQKDPREYLPYMQGLQELEPLRRSFQIDDKLGRRAKALRHLYDIPAFEECKAYTQKHELYAEALELVKYQPEQLREIMKLYADFMSSRDRHKEAGLAYDYLADYASATTSYQAAHLWRESLTSAMLVPYDAAALSALASALAENLIEMKDFSAAATIHLEYLTDIPAAAKLYCRGNFFAEAMRILTTHHQTTLIPTLIDPGLIDASASTTELLADFKSQLAAQVPRLRELRAKKAADPLAFYGGDPSAALANGVDIPDNVSLAPTDATTSAGTFMTRYTGRTGTINTTTTRRTSKNRRREERKRARGKKGSVYEEEYLVASVGRLIDRANSTAEEVERLVAGLVRRGMRERAQAVQELVLDVLGSCRACVGEVFLVEEEKRADEGLEGERPGGAEGVLWDSVNEGRGKREPPVVRSMARLALVG